LRPADIFKNMYTIALPKKIEFEDAGKPNQKKIIVEPCFPGYGVTLGNSIRRVLLSSLPGAAPVGIKIKGVDHEFMTLPHFKEDILEFILNLKNLRIKVFGDEVEKLELDVYGEKEVKASDIKKNSAVEIVNPGLVLWHITDMAGSLQAEIFVSTGMGYETVENRENRQKEIGYIEMDSIFSPVLSVGIRVENVRVGKMTNWDKLILDVVTDGTITPEEAFEKSVGILIDQFGAVLGKGPAEEEEEAAAVAGKEAADTDEKMIIGAAEEAKAKEAVKEAETEAEKSKEGGEEKPKRKRGRPKKAVE
jgi:DNA-directed RNA polymerase subunit alpha